MLPKFTTADIVVPFMAHAPISPTVSAQRMEALPTPLKSPVSATFHPAGTAPRTLVDWILMVDRSISINQIPTLLEVSLNRMSEEPLPSKSPMPTICQLSGAGPKSIEFTGPQVVEFKLTSGFEHSINQTPTSPV